MEATLPQSDEVEGNLADTGANWSSAEAVQDLLPQMRSLRTRFMERVYKDVTDSDPDYSSSDEED